MEWRLNLTTIRDTNNTRFNMNEIQPQDPTWDCFILFYLIFVL